MEQKLRRNTFKERYDFNCPKCPKQLWASPSIMMTGFGENSGHGTCPDCKTFFHLEIEGGLDGEKMISEVWDEWMKKRQEKNK